MVIKMLEHNKTYIIIKDKKTEIYECKKLHYFNQEEFSMQIGDKNYLIKGNNLELEEIRQDNETLTIVGEIYSITLSGNNPSGKGKKDDSFIKKLFK